jgi:steroid delta-isomerase-like uncharacterized protein
MTPVRMSKIESPTRAVLSYKEAFNNRDVDAILALLSEDCIFEPAQNGLILKGKAAIKTYLTEFFTKLPDKKLKGIDIFQAGFHVVFRWELDGKRGVDIFDFREGLISEKLSYQKV